MPRKELSVIVSANYRPSSLRFSLSLAMARVLFGLGVIAALAVAGALALLLTGAYKVMRLSYLERRNQALEAEFAKVNVLKERLQRLEENSRNVARMLGVELTPPPVDWDAAQADSTTLPDWVKQQVWGSHPVPVLVPVEGAAVSRVTEPGHLGVDLAGTTGLPVRASADGIVLQQGSDETYGRFVLLQHDSGYQTFYGHLADWSVRRGDTVLAGQGIGRVGSSGISTAPHLHFEIRKDDRRIDPATRIRF